MTLHTADVVKPSIALWRLDAFWKTALFVTVLMLSIVGLDANDGVPYFADPDDKLRAVQIHQFFMGKSWFDLSMTSISMPGPYISPWSRIVDAPYFLIASALAHMMAADQALQTAYIVWPPVMLLGFAWFSSIAMVRLLPEGARTNLVVVFFTILMMAFAVLEFTPKRIDHHNMQLLALSAMLAGGALWSRRGAVLSAFAVAVSVRIGLETFPLIAAFWVVLALAWVWNAKGAGPVFQAYSFAIAVFAPLLTLIFAGTDVLFQVQNDIFSLPYNAAFTGFGLISGVATCLLPGESGKGARLAILAIPGLVLLAAIVYFAPHILAGPYAIIDPLSRALWLDHVVQEHGILYLVRAGSSLILMMTVEQTCLAILAGAYAVSLARKGKAFPLIIYAVGLCSLLADFAALRFVRFPAATLTLFLPALVAQFWTIGPRAQRFCCVGIVVGPVGLAGVFQHVAETMHVNVETDRPAAADFLIYDRCPASDTGLFATLPPGRYMMPSRMGLDALQLPSLPFTVSNISYHRASPGIRGLLEAFYLDDPLLRRQALEPFDYVAFCSYPADQRKLFTPPPGTLFEALANEGSWPGLEPLKIADAQKLRVFRVNHAALR